MKLNQKDAMQTEDNEYIRQWKLRFRQRQRNSSLSVAIHPAHISQTRRHPQYRTAHVSHFGRHNNPHFLYFLAVGSLW